MATSVAPSGARRSQAVERVLDGRAVGEDVGVVPLGAGEDRHGRAVGIEVARVFVGFDDERATQPAPRGRRRPVRDRGRQQGPDERRRVQPGADEDVDEPAGRRALAVRPGDGHEVASDRRVGDDLLPRLPAARPIERAARSSG